MSLAQSPFPSEEDLIESFEEDLTLRDLGAEAKRHYLAYLRIASSFLNGRGKSLLDLQDLDVLRGFLTYLRKERKVSTKTAHHYLTALSSFCDFLLLEGYLSSNPIPAFRKRYLASYRSSRGLSRRKVISSEEMGRLINSVLSPRDKAILTVLAKTGVRRGELASIDIDDVDWESGCIDLKPKRKRTNRLVFLDEEGLRVLRSWVTVRDSYLQDLEERALFVGEPGTRLCTHSVYQIVTKHAGRLGIHDSGSEDLEGRFTPHCFRHWFTTMLRRGGMRRELIQELRGDSRKDAIDIYDHIDPEELQREYLRCIPALGL
ncbi:MAG: tyrosine-type recombinase/integrase [Thermoplasmata archaeon]|nr:tyrosine-type recombinase/integrase [Thermoplasmata archaeon]